MEIYILMIIICYYREKGCMKKQNIYCIKRLYFKYIYINIKILNKNFVNKNISLL